MDEIESFSKKVISAVEQKTKSFDEVILPQILEKYRLLHTSVKNLYDILSEKNLIKDDPYKLDKKISDIVPPEGSEYMESERSVVIGARLSDYESILDFICTYYKFSVGSLTINQIKKFFDFNNSFLWSSLSQNSPKPNTRGLAALITEARQGANSITNSMLNDVVTRSGKDVGEINTCLKELTDFQKEVYKAKIRKDIFDHPKFDKKKASNSLMEESQEIKKLFPAILGDQPFYPALIDEILKEDHAPNKATLQKVLLAKLETQDKKEEKTEEKIDTREMLMNAVHCLSSFAPQYETVVTKLNNNFEILEKEHNTILDKFMAVWRKAFGLKTPEVVYMITLIDPKTQVATKEKLAFHQFVQDLQKKISYYNSFALRKSPGYIKLENTDTDNLIEFLNKQIAAAQKTYTLLTGLDNYFKQTILPENKGMIKGLMMELTAIKNVIVKTNQERAEYLSYVEEQEQLKRLGITNGQ